MPTHQKPPPGVIYADDYEDPATGKVTPGIATLLGIAPSTLRKWRMAGKGPTTFIHGKKIAAREQSIHAYFEALEREAEGFDPEPRVISQRSAA